MVNQIVLVGRIARTPETKVTENGKKYSTLTLAVPRNYKNQNGEYDTDFLDCTLWTGIAENTAEYCKSGDVIGVKGRLQTWLLENEDGSKYKKVEIVAEKVTFLSSARNDKVIDNTVNDENIEDSNGEVTEIDVVKESTRKYNKKKK